MSRKKKLPKEVTSIQKYSLPERLEGSKSISYSQLSTYGKCKYKWYLKYAKGLEPFSASIHTVFGTAMHETIQEWLDIMYNTSVKASNEYDFAKNLQSYMWKEYRKEVVKRKEHFSTPEELYSFYTEGLAILDYLKSKRTLYFTSKKVYLVGIEVPLLLPLENKVYLKGYIDVVMYDSRLDTYEILDIKTSTKGWGKYKKADKNTTDQLVLYKHYFAKQFNVDPSKIKIKYLIVKRQVPEDPEYPTMSRRVQEFSPSNGSVSMSRVVKNVKSFVESQFKDGKIIDESPSAQPSKSTCRFCYFKDKKHLCKFGVD